MSNRIRATPPMMHPPILVDSLRNHRIRIQIPDSNGKPTTVFELTTDGEQVRVRLCDAGYIAINAHNHKDLTVVAEHP